MLRLYEPCSTEAEHVSEVGAVGADFSHLASNNGEESFQRPASVSSSVCASFQILPSLLLAFLMQDPSGVDMDSITVFEPTDIPARAGTENTSCLD